MMGWPFHVSKPLFKGQDGFFKVLGLLRVTRAAFCSCLSVFTALFFLSQVNTRFGHQCFQ